MKSLCSKKVRVHFKGRWGIIVNGAYLYGKIKHGSFVGTSDSGRLYYKKPLIVQFQSYECKESWCEVRGYRLIDNKTGRCCDMSTPLVYRLGWGEDITITMTLREICGYLQGN